MKFLIRNLHLLSHGIGVFSRLTGELDLDRRLGTFKRSPSAGLDATIKKPQVSVCILIIDKISLVKDRNTNVSYLSAALLMGL